MKQQESNKRIRRRSRTVKEGTLWIVEKQASFSIRWSIDFHGELLFRSHMFVSHNLREDGALIKKMKVVKSGSVCGDVGGIRSEVGDTYKSGIILASSRPEGRVSGGGWGRAGGGGGGGADGGGAPSLSGVADYRGSLPKTALISVEIESCEKIKGHPLEGATGFAATFIPGAEAPRKGAQERALDKSRAIP
jgi:hypothetical protein